MYARVARWEGGTADEIRDTAEQMKRESQSGPPPGVPASGFMMLADPDNGRTLGIVLFDTEEDMRTGDAALNEMNPGGSGTGRRTSVEMYEVAIDVKA